MKQNRFNVQLVPWLTHEPELRAVRTAVFVREQHVPLALEWDGEDASATHALAVDGTGQAIGTARLIMQGALAHIGRMAVLPMWRGQGVGAQLLASMLAEARQQGATEAYLNAQTSAVPFYAKFGFVREGDEFLDAGIPHYRMTLKRVAP